MKNHAYPIMPEGFLFFIPFAFLACLFAVLSWSIAATLSGLLAVFVIWFFRNPERDIPDDEKGIVSPADGRILKIEEGQGMDGFPEGFTKVSIFMSLFNVHVNRAPCSGQVKNINYREGKFFSANLDKASTENESNAVTITTDDSGEIRVVQIAGLVARRIVCWLEEGMRVTRGERFGMIRFGSRLEVFAPRGTRIIVSPGDKVKAGATTIGFLP